MTDMLKSYTIILVCGGRAFADRAHVAATLERASEFYGKVAILQGGASGADALAKEWAESKGVPSVEMRAPWKFYQKKAGMLRNQWMLDVCEPDVVIAFRGGVGTAGMCAIARAAGVATYEV